MGEGDLGLLYALVVLSPYIGVGLFCAGGLLLLVCGGRGAKIAGGIMLAVAALGVLGTPVFNSLSQDQRTDRFLDVATVPASLDMQGATVLVVGSQSPDCALLCAAMADVGHVARIYESRIGEGPAEAIYHAGPFDLRGLEGFVWSGEGGLRTRETVPDEIDFVLFNETHWLAYHDPQSFLQFPPDAYSGVFLYRVTDAAAFDVSQAELVFQVYQSEQQPGRFLWFSETTNDRSLPSNATIARVFTAALTAPTPTGAAGLD